MSLQMERLMNQLVNPAIFAYGLYAKFADWRNAALPIILLLMPAFSLLTYLFFPHQAIDADSQKRVADSVAGYFYNPLVNMILAYCFVSDGLANRKFSGDSDTFSLLFTRPVTRFSYVLSKFAAGLVGSSLVLCLGLLLAWGVGYGIGVKCIDIGPLAVLSIICTAASNTSLIVFMHSAPPLVAIIGFTFLLGASGIGNTFVGTDSSNNQYLELFKSICLFINHWFGDLLPDSINLGQLLSATCLDTLEISIFVSNIAFYLLIASLALNKREFFYGSD